MKKLTSAITIFILFSFSSFVYASNSDLISEIDSLLENYIETDVECKVSTVDDFAHLMISSLNDDSANKITNLLPTSYAFLNDLRERLSTGNNVSASKVKRIVEGFKNDPELYEEIIGSTESNISLSFQKVKNQIEEYNLDFTNAKIIDLDTSNLDVEGGGGLSDGNGTLIVVIKMDNKYYKLKIYDLMRKSGCWATMPQSNRGLHFRIMS